MTRELTLRSMLVLWSGGLALALSACSERAPLTSVEPVRAIPAERPSLTVLDGDFEFGRLPNYEQAAIAISPNASSCTVGSPCTVDVGMWVGGGATYGIEFQLHFDARLLQAVSVTIPTGSPYPNSPMAGQALNHIDNFNGVVSFSAMSAINHGISSGNPFAVATIVFMPLSAGTSFLIPRFKQWIDYSVPLENYRITTGTVSVTAGTPTPKVFTSGSQVDTWDAIPELIQPTNWAPYCTTTPKVGLNANWVNPHKAFVLTGHSWATDYFSAPWINAWNNLASILSGSPGPGNYNWTKYHTMVEGTGTFVVRLLADNCSWIYLDDRLVGIQGTDLSQNSYGVTLNGKHRLDFIIFDGGGAAGGKFILETTTNPPPPLVVDATPPVITHTITGTPGTGGWYTSPVTVTWSVTAGSTITSPTCAPQTISANTAAAGVVVTCSATSAGGTATDPVTIKLDLSVPTVVATVPAATGANGWYITDIPVSWTVTGAGPSGIVTTCPSTVVSTETTGTTQACTATTGAGLSASGTTASLKLDKTPPVLTGIPTGLLGNNGWYRSNATVNWTATDNISGVANPPCTANTLSVDNAGTTFTCVATNGAGLSSTLAVTVKRDATPPSIGYTGNLGTYTVDQTVNITCFASDAMSALATNTCANINGTAYSFTLGTNTYSASATDKAGNGSSATTTFTIQVTAGSLCSLVERFVSQQGVAYSLCVKLDHGSWEPFRNELSAQTGKKISDANAAILLRLVNALAAQ
jgi:hypothetical protein